MLVLVSTEEQVEKTPSALWRVLEEVYVMLKLNHLLPGLLVTTQGAPTQYVIWLVFSVFFIFFCSLLKVSENEKLLDSCFAEIKQLPMRLDVEKSTLKIQEMIIEDEANEKVYVFFMIMVNNLA